MKVGAKRHNENTDHGTDETKRFKGMDNTVQTEIQTMEVEAQSHQAQ